MIYSWTSCMHLPCKYCLYCHIAAVCYILCTESIQMQQRPVFLVETEDTTSYDKHVLLTNSHHVSTGGCGHQSNKEPWSTIDEIEMLRTVRPTWPKSSRDAVQVGGSWCKLMVGRYTGIFIHWMTEKLVSIINWLNCRSVDNCRLKAVKSKFLTRTFHLSSYAIFSSTVRSRPFLASCGRGESLKSQNVPLGKAKVWCFSTKRGKKSIMVMTTPVLMPGFRRFAV